MKKIKVIEWILAHFPIYIPSQFLEKLIPMKPSYHGENCLYNGENPGIECGCEECDNYVKCFPDWAEYWTWSQSDINK